MTVDYFVKNQNQIENCLLKTEKASLQQTLHEKVIHTETSVISFYKILRFCVDNSRENFFFLTTTRLNCYHDLRSQRIPIDF